MATNFQFDPVEGLQNKTVFPTYPANEDEARLQFQTPLNQIRDFINNNLLVNMGTWFTFKDNGGNIKGNISVGTQTSSNYYNFQVLRTLAGKEVIAELGITALDSDIGGATLQFKEKSTGITLGYLNISNTAITSNNLDLGTNSKKFKDGYFSDNIYSSKLYANSGGTGYVGIGDNFGISSNITNTLLSSANSKPVLMAVKDGSGATVSGVVLQTDKSLTPATSIFDTMTLGNTTYPWKDLWLNGSTRNTNGYAKLSNEMLIQWGVASVPNGTNTTVTFPISFPRACWNLSATVSSGGGTSSSPSVNTSTTTNFKIVHNNANPLTIMWFAIGY